MRRSYAVGGALGLAVLLAGVGASAAGPAQPVANVGLSSSEVHFQPLVSANRWSLTVTGPNDFVFSEESAGSPPAFSIWDRSGSPLTDGVYRYELRALPAPFRSLQTIESASRTRDVQTVDELARQGRSAGPRPGTRVAALPALSGSFTISGGAVVVPTGVEETVRVPRTGTRRQTDAAPSAAAAPTLTVAEDLIVQGSACVGIDCVNGESFGFDTIRLKENNLRIKFQDTSVGAFPSTDWQLTANDSASGGLNKFSIEDITGARVPFTVEGGATTNSVYIDSTGRVGFRTSTPVLDLHVATGNTPAMRLEQNGSSGFTAQTWDVAGNEANFFIRDVTSGSRLPFKIKPGASNNSIVIDSDGDVGLGILTPTAGLHVARTTGAFTNLMRLSNNSGVGFVLSNSAGNDVFISVNNTATAFTVNFSDGDGPELSLDAAGNLTGVTSCSGCAPPSDRSLKENFAEIDRDAVLERLLELDVQAWNYKDIAPEERHIGPVSQDFHAAFQVGRDVTISPVDTFGVTAAAIQALSGQVSELRDLVARQQALIEELKARGE